MRENTTWSTYHGAEHVSRELQTKRSIIVTTRAY